MAADDPPSPVFNRARGNSIISFPASSRASSVLSLASTLTDSDNHELRTLRRLLMRKIEPRLDLAFDEADRVEAGLKVVSGVMRGVRGTLEGEGGGRVAENIV
jgi:hypothetical protein